MKTVDERRQRPERVASDRRDSARVERGLRVRAEGAEVAAPVQGELGLGGASWRQTTPVSPRYEVSFHLPDLAEDVVAKAEVVRTEPEATATRVRVRFVELPLVVELALARFVESAARLDDSLRSDVKLSPPPEGG
jgi:hypothetical protein